MAVCSFGGIVFALLFSIAHVYPPEDPLLRVMGIFAGFMAAYGLVGAAVREICNTIEKQKK